MIEIRTLGTFELRDAASPAGVAPLAPRPAALLAYLALARPRGSHSRDELLALFWPEVPDGRARGALNQALYRLRRTLGPEPLLSLGDRDVALDSERIRCDAWDLETALDEGRTEAGLDLYGGHLLEGFHLSGAPEFERWLDAERARVQRRVTEAARGLVAALEAAGNPAAALLRVRQALAWAPYDEALLRQLLRLLHRLGDRAGALREYRRFTARLAADLEVAPSAETRALAEAIRRPEPADPRERTSVEVDAPWGDDAASGRAAMEPPATARRRMRGRLGVILVVLALAVLPTAVGVRRPEAAAPAHAAAQRVVLLPFTLSGDSSLTYLRAAMVDLLADGLSIPGQLETVDPRAFLESAPARVRGAPPLEQGRTLAARFQADGFLLGTIVQGGGHARFSATLHGADGTPRAAATAEMAGEDSLFRAVDRLALGLLAGTTRGAARRPARTAAATTRSLPALKSYLAGERALQGGRFDASVDAFRRAVELDSTFALAYRRLAQASDWSGAYDLAASSADRAWQLREGMPERTRLLVEADHALRHRGSGEVVEARLLAAVQQYPDDAEAQYQLADTYFHSGHWGVPVAAIRAGFERVLELDPEHAAALLHLARIAAAQQDRAALDMLVRRALARDSLGEYGIELRALHAFTMGDEAARRRSIEEFGRLDDVTLTRLVFRTAVYSGDLAGSRALARLMTAAQRSIAQQAVGHVALAVLEAGRGRMHAARTHLADADLLSSPLALAARALLAVLPPLPADSAELRRIRQRLASWDAARVRSPALAAGHVYVLFLPHVPHFLLALADARSGELAAALRRADELERRYGEPGQRAARLVRAFVERGRGRPAEALALIGVETRGLTSDFAPLEGHLRAELLYSLGQLRPALRWYAAQTGEIAYAVPLLAPSHLRRAELHERLGEDAEAARHYSRFIELWKDCDEELRPLVEHAMRRLRALSAVASARGRG